MSIENTMIEVAESQYEKLEELDTGSEEFVKTARVANEIMEQVNEVKKTEIEEKKLKVDRWDRILKHVVTVATGAAYLAGHIWAIKDNQKWELRDNNMYTSDGGRAAQRGVLSFIEKLRK